MGIIDFLKAAAIVGAVDHLQKSKKHRDEIRRLTDGSWRKEVDRENDMYHDYYHDDDDF